MKRISFIRLGALLSALIILASCGSVPVTGRKQVLLVSDQEVNQAGLTQYNEYMATATLSSDAKSTEMVKSAGLKLAEATEKYLKANGFESDLANLLFPEAKAVSGKL